MLENYKRQKKGRMNTLALVPTGIIRVKIIKIRSLLNSARQRFKKSQLLGASIPGHWQLPTAENDCMDFQKLINDGKLKPN